MRAIKIMMKNETPNSNNPKDIISFYIENESGRIEEYKIEKLYEMLIEKIKEYVVSYTCLFHERTKICKIPTK